MKNLTDDRRRYPRLANRKRIVVATEIHSDTHREIQEIMTIYDCNRSRVLRACIEVGLPILLEQARQYQQEQDELE